MRAVRLNDYKVTVILLFVLLRDNDIGVGYSGGQHLFVHSVDVESIDVLVDTSFSLLLLSLFRLFIFLLQRLRVFLSFASFLFLDLTMGVSHVIGLNRFIIDVPTFFFKPFESIFVSIMGLLFGGLLL